MELFTHEIVTDRIIRIIDIFKTAAYLILGENRACLIDTCNGIGDLKTYVESLTQLPYDVVLTHGHFDHAGAASLFKDVYLHPNDNNVYHEYYDHPMKQAFIQTLPKEIADLMNPQRKQPFLPLYDKQVFDLGGLCVEMIEVKGHTQGMMMAFIQEERVMLFGDACGEGVLIFDDHSSTISEYKKSLLRIQNEYSNKYDDVIRNHGTFVSDKDILENVIECCDDILAKKDDAFPVTAVGVIHCFAAKKVDEKNQRIDGKHGNITYRFDKAI